MMRNVLNDVARNQFGPEGSARNRADVPLGGSSSIPGFIPPDPKITAPDELMARSEFHECVEKLPRDLRDVVDLHSYQEFTLKEVADLLDIGVATAQRRWSRAKIALIKLLHNFRPEHL